MKTFSLKRLISVILIIGAVFVWLKNRYAWDCERTRNALSAREKADGTGYELYSIEMTVYEDDSGREVAPPVFGRQLGWYGLVTVATFGLILSWIGKVRQLPVVREIGIAALGVVCAVVLTEVVLFVAREVIWQLRLRWFGIES